MNARQKQFFYAIGFFYTNNPNSLRAQGIPYAIMIDSDVKVGFILKIVVQKQLPQYYHVNKLKRRWNSTWHQNYEPLTGMNGNVSENMIIYDEVKNFE